MYICISFITLSFHELKFYKNLHCLINFSSNLHFALRFFLSLFFLCCSCKCSYEVTVDGKVNL